MSLTPFQLVHGPSTKTRVAYILSLLRDPAGIINDSTLMEDDEDDSDVEDGDITMLNTEVIVTIISTTNSLYFAEHVNLWSNHKHVAMEALFVQIHAYSKIPTLCLFNS